MKLLDRTLLVCVLTLVASACTDPAVNKCRKTSDCGDGKVCVNRLCTQLCLRPDDCAEGLACVQGVCTTASDESAPQIDAIAGNATGDTTRIDDGLVISGSELRNAAFELRQGSLVAVLAVRSQDNLRAEVALPSDVRQGVYELAAINAAGVATASVTLILPDLNGDVLVERINTAGATRLVLDRLPTEITALPARLAALEQRPVLTYDTDGVAQDGGQLPRRNCKPVTLTTPNAGDLGDQISAYLPLYRCLSFTLAANTGWTWNTPINTESGQELTIVGEGYTNGANTITVHIYMNQNRAFFYTNPTTNATTEYRVPERLNISDNSRVTIEGVSIEETPLTLDTRPLSPGPGGALFNSSGVNSTLLLQQSRIVTTEDVVGVGSRAFFHVLFGHLWIDKANLSPRPSIYAVKSYVGWAFGGGFGFVHASHTHFDEGRETGTTASVTIQSLPSKIFVSN